MSLTQNTAQAERAGLCWKIFLVLAVLCLVLITCLSSCQKEEEDPPVIPCLTFDTILANEFEELNQRQLDVIHAAYEADRVTVTVEPKNVANWDINVISIEHGVAARLSYTYDTQKQEWHCVNIDWVDSHLDDYF